MIVGVSRVKQAKACERQWWFGEVAGVTLPHSYGQVFGNVLHACVERWLKEEEPYPPGWQWCPESKQRVDQGDDDLIQSMVHQAIEKGYLRRHPDRQVEQTWWTVLESDAGLSGFGHQVLVAKGTIDLSEPGVIADHKGSKNVKSYAKTKAELRTDLQLLVYLYVNEIRRGIRHKDDDVLTVGHINYCRATGQVSEKTVKVTWADAIRAWADFVKTSRRLLPLAQETDLRRVPCALDKPAREDGKRACDDYAGCGYLPICSAKDKLGEFEKFKIRNFRASLPPKARPDFQRSIEEMVKSKVSKGKTVKPAAEDEDDEDEAPAPKSKAKKPNPFEDDEDEAEDEDEEPAPKPKKKAAPVVEDDEEDEEPAPKPKKKVRPAPEIEDGDDEEDEEPIVDDEENEEPAPPPKKKAKASPVEDEEETVEEAVAPTGSLAKVGRKEFIKSLRGEEVDVLIKRLADLRDIVLGNV